MSERAKHMELSIGEYISKAGDDIKEINCPDVMEMSLFGMAYEMAGYVNDGLVGEKKTVDYSCYCCVDGIHPTRENIAREYTMLYVEDYDDQGYSIPNLKKAVRDANRKNRAFGKKNVTDKYLNGNYTLPLKIAASLIVSVNEDNTVITDGISRRKLKDIICRIFLFNNYVMEAILFHYVYIALLEFKESSSGTLGESREIIKMLAEGLSEDNIKRYRRKYRDEFIRRGVENYNIKNAKSWNKDYIGLTFNKDGASNSPQNKKVYEDLLWIVRTIRVFAERIVRGVEDKRVLLLLADGLREFLAKHCEKSDVVSFQNMDCGDGMGDAAIDIDDTDIDMLIREYKKYCEDSHIILGETNKNINNVWVEE